MFASVCAAQVAINVETYKQQVDATDLVSHEMQNSVFGSPCQRGVTQAQNHFFFPCSWRMGHITGKFGDDR